MSSYLRDTTLGSLLFGADRRGGVGVGSATGGPESNGVPAFAGRAERRLRDARKFRHFLLRQTSFFPKMVQQCSVGIIRPPAPSELHQMPTLRAGTRNVRSLSGWAAYGASPVILE